MSCLVRTENGKNRLLVKATLGIDFLSETMYLEDRSVHLQLWFSSRCPESQRESALLGQFATTDPECKVHVVQRGVVRPLIRMLEASDPRLREMAAFALGRLAQNTHNRVGIVRDGGLKPLFELLD